MRPEVGDRLVRCAECRGYEYSGAPGCVTCRDLVDDIIEDEWRSFLGRFASTDNQVDTVSGRTALDSTALNRTALGEPVLGEPVLAETVLAEMVVDEPHRHDWRIVDAALDRLNCPDCGDRLSRGPVGCAACDVAHGFRYSAIETDRPGVPPGNEHAIRVNVSVVRRPLITSANELLLRRLFLPALLTGFLPSTAEAQRVSALIRKSPPERRTDLIERFLDDAFARTRALDEESE